MDAPTNFPLLYVYHSIKPAGPALLRYVLHFPAFCGFLQSLPAAVLPFARC